MSGKRPDYEVFTSRDSGDGETQRYTKIGAAWKVAKDGISIKLDALPITDSVVIFPVREKEQGPR